MKKYMLLILIAITFLFQGCALRVGLKPDVRESSGRYPPFMQGKSCRVFCLPCFEFSGWGFGLLFVGGWPSVFYRE